MQDIQVEPGPQDGTLLVTWQTVTRPPSSGPVTGYAVYADGKKVLKLEDAAKFIESFKSIFRYHPGYGC